MYLPLSPRSLFYLNLLEVSLPYLVEYMPMFSNKSEYSGPYILRPPMGPGKCGLILQVILKQR